MTDMVERVARALCPTSWANLDKGLARPGDDAVRDRSLELARAAIEAMNPPTEEMLDAAHEPARKAFIEFRDSNSIVSVICSESIWKAMLTAALVSQPPDRGGE